MLMYIIVDTGKITEILVDTKECDILHSSSIDYSQRPASDLCGSKRYFSQ